jgi:hypothetical protein
MSAIDTAMLAAMREAIEDLLPDTCDILSTSRSFDTMGGWTDTWGTATASVACRLDMKGGVEQLIGGGVRPYTRYMMSLPYNTTVTEANRIQHGGLSYAVISVNTSQSWQAVKRVELEKV